MYRRGLVVGKFCPLHKGHELLIETAIKACDQVIIISYTNPDFDGCSAATRRKWLSNLYPDATSLVIDQAWLAESSSGVWQNLPHNDADDKTHRAFCAWICSDILKLTVDAVFTSEDYGDGFAKALSGHFTALSGSQKTVAHVSVDEMRSRVSIAGSDIRRDVHANRQFLSDTVYGSFLKCAVLLGGESTGKTTLCAAIAKRLGTQWVPEYGRELTEQKNHQLIFEDLLHIGKVQIDREEGLAGKSNQWLICDTSPLTTAFYSEAMFGRVDPELVRLADRSYDKVFLCEADFDFVQDGHRETADFRDWQQYWYKAELNHRNVDYTVLSGPLEKRIQTMLEELRV